MTTEKFEVCNRWSGTVQFTAEISVPHASDSPAEQWFAPIRKGVKPGDDSEGGFRSAKALKWALEYAAATGIVIEEPTR